LVQDNNSLPGRYYHEKEEQMSKDKKLTNITSRTSNMGVVQEAAKEAALHTPELAVQIQT
jgi:hypothetical protein